MSGATAVRGSVLSTPDGIAALEAGVTTVVAKPALAVRLMAVCRRIKS